MDLSNLMTFWCLILTLFKMHYKGKLIYSLQKTSLVSLDYDYKLVMKVSPIQWCM